MVWVSDAPPAAIECRQAPSAPVRGQADTCVPPPQFGAPETLVVVSMHSWLVPDPVRHENELPSLPQPTSALTTSPITPTNIFM